MSFPITYNYYFHTARAPSYFFSPNIHLKMGFRLHSSYVKLVKPIAARKIKGICKPGAAGMFQITIHYFPSKK